MATGFAAPLPPEFLRFRMLEIDYSDLVVAATSKSFNFLDSAGSADPLEDNALVLGAQVRVVTAFAGATVTAIALDVGDSLRAGTGALSLAFDALKAGTARQALVAMQRAISSPA